MMGNTTIPNFQIINILSSMPKVGRTILIKFVLVLLAFLSQNLLLAQCSQEYLVGDWDGDGIDNITIRIGREFYADLNNDGILEHFYDYGTGGPLEDEYLVGDWNGDNIDDIAVRRGSEILMDWDRDGVPNFTQAYGAGNGEDEYLVGNWDGIGGDNIAVRRGSEILLNYDFDTEPDLTVAYGTGTDNLEDEYLVGDWNGDDIDDIAVRRGNQLLMTYSFGPGTDLTQTFRQGNSEDEYLVGNWDCDNKDNFATRIGTSFYIDFDFDQAQDLQQVITKGSTCAIWTSTQTFTNSSPSLPTITNSTCTVFNGTPAGGAISGPTTTNCPDGSVFLQYSTNGINFSSFIPTYNQTTPMTIYTRCACVDGYVVSRTNQVTTAPEDCPAVCVNVSAAAPLIRNSTCTVFNGTPSGGVIARPEPTNCPIGSVIEYSTDGTNFSTTLPTYNQAMAMTIYSRCDCNIEEITQITTTPDICPTTCVDVTAASPIITNSSCTVFNGTPSGGTITAPNITNCPTGSVIEYSTDGTNFSTSVPTYNQTTAQTIYTRCDCNSEDISQVATTPGSCPARPRNCGEAVITCFPDFINNSASNGINKSAAVLGVVDIRDQSALSPGDYWAAQSGSNIYHPAHWNYDNLGLVFGLAIDGNNNIYTASTTVYGCSFANNESAFGPSGKSRIYKIDVQDNITTFIAEGAFNPTGNGHTIPSNGAGFGNICYDADHNQLFATNFHDGFIYRIDLVTEKVVDRFDPFSTTNDPSSSNSDFVALGDRPWGIGYYDNKIYYGLWSEDRKRPSATDFNSIWSLDLNLSTGAFLASNCTANTCFGGDQLVVNLPNHIEPDFDLPPSTIDYSNPISDIAFSKDGKMLVSERSMGNDCGNAETRDRDLVFSFAHNARVIEYEKNNAGLWKFTPGHATNTPPFTDYEHELKFVIGHPFPERPFASNASGGVDYGYKSFNPDSTISSNLICDNMVWATADFAQCDFDNNRIYGLLGLNAKNGGNSCEGYTIDFDGNAGNNATFNKRQQGDVETFKCGCFESQVDCEDLAVEVNTSIINEESCCFFIDITNNVGQNITKLEVEILSGGMMYPPTIFHENLSVDADSITTVACLRDSVNGSIPIGQSANAFKICLTDANGQIPTTPQTVVFRWYELIAPDCEEVVCTDTLEFECSSPRNCGETAITCFPGFNNNSPSAGINPTLPVLGIVDIRDRSTVNPGDYWAAQSGNNIHHPSHWNYNNLGLVFGLAIDQSDNIYTTSTTVYGCSFANNGSPFGPSGKSRIYKIDAHDNITIFIEEGAFDDTGNGNTIPSNGAGFGNICYDKDHDQLFVTNFHDGLIYRIKGGKVIDRFDPFTPFNNNSSDNTNFVELGERPWGIAYYDNKLYYGRWWEDRDRRNSSTKNEIWSVDLKTTGEYNASHIQSPNTYSDNNLSDNIVSRPEIMLPDHIDYLSPSTYSNYSSPVSDIAFSKDGKMLLAERTMGGDCGDAARSQGGVPFNAHQSRVLEYEGQSGNWQLTSGHGTIPFTNYKSDLKFYIANPLNLENNTDGSNSAGGVDYGYKSFNPANDTNFICDDMVWLSGDFLQVDNANRIYGMLGLHADQGGNVNNGFTIDYDGAIASSGVKIMQGDVEIFDCGCFESQVDCEDLAVEVDTKIINETTCCSFIDITNNVGQNITKLEAEVISTDGAMYPPIIFQENLSVDTDSITTIACIRDTVNGYIPIGNLTNAFKICLTDANGQIPTTPQTIVFRWYEEIAPDCEEVVCTDTLIFDCTPPFTVICPADTTVSCSDWVDVFYEPIMTGMPIVLPASNTDISITFEDNFHPHDSCTITFTRTWEIIDSSIYQVDSTLGLITCTQQITTLDTLKPEIICTEDISVQGQFNGNDSCIGFITIPLPYIRDSCSSMEYYNDYNYTNDASDNYPVGTTTVTWFVEDYCGNITNCSFTVTVEDCKVIAPCEAGDFVKLIGDSLNNYFNEVKFFNDAFYAVGNTETTPYMTGTFSKISRSGQLEWTMGLENHAVLYDFEQIDENEFLLVGRTDPIRIGSTWQDNKSVISRVRDDGSDGNVVWTRTYQMDTNGRENFLKIAKSKISTNTSPYYIAGVINNTSSPSTFDELIMLNVDEDGNINCSNRYTTNASIDHEIHRDILPLDNGGIAIVGAYTNSTKSAALFFDADCGLAQAFQFNGNSVIYGIQPIKNSTDYLLIGTTNTRTQGFICRVDANMNMVGTGLRIANQNRFYKLAEDAAGNYYVLGETTSNPKKTIINKFTVSNSGTVELLWSKYFDNGATGFFWGSLVSTDNELFYSDCRNGHADGLGNFDVLIASTDTAFNSCITQTFSSTTSDFTLTTQTDNSFNTHAVGVSIPETSDKTILVDYSLAEICCTPPVACPILAEIAPASPIITNAICNDTTNIPSGGLITAPITSNCPDGAALKYSIDSLHFTDTIPTYNQTTAMTIYTRCDCDNGQDSSIVSQVTTMPDTCPPPCANCDESTMAIAADIRVGGGSSNPNHIVEYNGILYFSADDGVHGMELWSFDGTTATLVEDINVGMESSKPEKLIVYKGKLYFTTTFSSTNVSLWSYDGTTTTEVYNWTGPIRKGFVAYNGQLYFSATEAATGLELWTFDGTTASLVQDFNIGGGSSAPSEFVVYNQALYFNILLNGKSRWAVYQGGSTIEVDPEIPLYYTSLYNGKIYYLTFIGDSPANNAEEVELWSFDGNSHTLELSSFYSGRLVGEGQLGTKRPDIYTFCNELIFTKTDNANGLELWSYDGTTATRITDINPNAASSSPSIIGAFNGQLVFRAFDGENHQLWSYNTSDIALSLYEDVFEGYGFGFQTIQFNGDLYFYGNEPTSGRELWSMTCAEVACPSLAEIMPASPIITNSSCNSTTGIPSGGFITAPTTSNCPDGAALKYSIDSLHFTDTIPAYNQTDSITIYTRCDCNNGQDSSLVSQIITIPNSCPTGTGEDCTSPINITIDGAAVNHSLSEATNSGIAPPCATTTDIVDAWFATTADENGSLEIFYKTPNNIQQQYGLAFWTDCSGNQERLLHCIPPPLSGGGNGFFPGAFSPNQPIYIQLWAYQPNTEVVTLETKSICTILFNNQALEQTCDDQTATYSQKVSFEYYTILANPIVMVKDADFNTIYSTPATGSPQEIIIPNLPADGTSQDYTIGLDICGDTGYRHFNWQAPNSDCSIKGSNCINPIALDVANFERPCVNLDFATDSGVNPSCTTPENTAIKDYWFTVQTDDIGSLKLEIGDSGFDNLAVGFTLYDDCLNPQSVVCMPSPISDNNYFSWTLPAELRVPNKIWALQLWAYADNEQTVCVSALPECGITNTTIGTATCIDETTFSQDIEIEFFNIPGKDLIVYDPLDNYTQILSTPFTSSPQTITITGLDATATEIDFDLSISGAHGCTTKFLDNIPIPDCSTINDCSDTPLVVSNTLSTDAIFKSKISITSTATILSNTNIDFLAGQSITLAAGFHAQAGSNFLAQIADCQIQTIQESTDITPVNNKSATESNIDLLAKEVAPEVADLKIAPNPFNQQTQIDYYLPKGGFTHLSIRDITGQIVAPMVAEDKGKGWHQIQFNNTNLLSGIYYLSMYTENNIISKKIVILNN